MRKLAILILLVIFTCCGCSNIFRDSYQNVKKPVIYLYPEKTTNTTIKINPGDVITASYPEYETEWNVVANPDGTIIDTKSQREFDSLFYEAKLKNAFNMKTYGFIVKGDDIQEFLEEKLDLFGLTTKETNDFIVYWMPILKQNKYNYVCFVDSSEIDDKVELDITPKPDKVIRLWMLYKPIDKPINLVEPEIHQNRRYGFTVVEWGGLQIE